MKTLIFDTETTGLIKNSLVPLARQPQIIEFFGLSYVGGEEDVGKIEFLFNPGKKLDREVINITKITDEMLVGKPEFRAHAEEIKQFIEFHDVVVAHNMHYDKSMVNFEMKRCGLEVNWPRLVCTVEATESIKGFRLNLMSLHEFLFGEAFTEAHRAENDVRALARCYFELQKRGVV